MFDFYRVVVEANAIAMASRKESDAKARVKHHASENADMRYTPGTLTNEELAVFEELVEEEATATKYAYATCIGFITMAPYRINMPLTAEEQLKMDALLAMQMEAHWPKCGD